MILVTAEEMRRLDAETIQGIGVPGAVLMESAGRGVVEVMAQLGALDGARICVLAGPGNNGGDGAVVARHLSNRGARVELVLAAPRARVTGDAALHLAAAEKSGVPVVDGSDGHLEQAAAAIARAAIVVDALLGTGVARAVEGHLARLIEAANRASALRVAVDLPSGMDADRGVALGACIEAHHTVSFGFAKLGLVGWPGCTRVGELHVVDIGIPARLASSLKRRLLGDVEQKLLAAPRATGAHKGTFGHALIVAGSHGHTGAALLAGEACARAGAGLTTIASPDGAQAALAARVVEVMTAPLGPEPLDGAWARLEPLTRGKRAIAFGPGVPRQAGTRALLAELLAAWQGPLVLDADGLNLLAEDLAPLARTRAQVIVTPHPAEMARLAGVATDAVQADRVGTAERFAARHGVVVALKGARTVVAAPDGRTGVNPTGNPGMASGGTGDVLTGVVAALCAQGLAPFEAACAGVWLHGRAGDLAAAARGEAGLLARDLVDELPRARRPPSEKLPDRR
jgi:NAD(P)H-hydrate epimerase